MRRIPFLALFFAALVLNPATSAAQTSDLRIQASHTTANSAGQSLVAAARFGISQPVTPAAVALEPTAAFRSGSLRHRGPGVALMIVGAAGVVTGLLLEESIITILGAGAGLVGLYIYLR